MTRTALTVLLVAVLLCGSCSSPSPARPAAPHPRLVTFSPALTHLAFAAGAGEHVVACTDRCLLPQGQQRPRVGDAVRVAAERVALAEPDVLLAQTQPEQFDAVKRLLPELRIEHFTIETLDDIAEALRRIGRLTGREPTARAAAERFEARIRAVRQRTAGLDRPRVLYVLGYDQLFVAGGRTFIDEMIAAAGGVNAGDPGRAHQRWRSVTLEQVVAARPEVILCQASENERELALRRWQQAGHIPAVRDGRVFVVCDRRWTIPGTWMAGFCEQLAEMLHGPAVGAPAGGQEQEGAR